MYMQKVPVLIRTGTPLFHLTSCIKYTPLHPITGIPGTAYLSLQLFKLQNALQQFLRILLHPPDSLYRLYTAYSFLPSFEYKDIIHRIICQGYQKPQELRSILNI